MINKGLEFLKASFSRIITLAVLFGIIGWLYEITLRFAVGMASTHLTWQEYALVGFLWVIGAGIPLAGFIFAIRGRLK